jgi:type II secretory ATPase GspE/PulE/Tfp pilus assembly ATPase PilB-like protein
VLALPHGMIIVTGPTGSGKTTTLATVLSLLNEPTRKILTIEDPVEYEIPGICQSQAKPSIGLTFATALRAFVRQDPDVIMVGEVRDRDTAQLAVEAALTGHLVLTTLHTNDAPLAAARLVDMGIEPYLVSAGVECVVAQRLVRRLCECRVPVKVTKTTLTANGFRVGRGFSAFEPGGCVRCGHSGFRGRIGLYELMTISDEQRRLILAKAPADELRELARSEGMRTLREDGLEKVKQGVTSVGEVLRVLGASAAG